MNYILTVSFANETVTAKSYQRLVDTIRQPYKVLLWDNHYPLNSPDFLDKLCKTYKFERYTLGINIGLYAAWNCLLAYLPDDVEKVILFDGDNYPIENDWHLALTDVIGGPVVHSTLMHHVNRRELNERGFTSEVIKGVRVRVTNQPCTNTTCAFSVDFLNQVGGVTGGKTFYGGNELTMWPFYEGKKWVFLEDFTEGKEEMMPLHDWQYYQYKLLYAHKGLEGDFKKYLASNPERIEDLEKQIFG